MLTKSGYVEFTFLIPIYEFGLNFKTFLWLLVETEIRIYEIMNY